MSRKFIQNCTGGECANKENQKTQHVVMRVVFYVLALFFVGVTIYLLFFSPQMQINNVTVSGTQELDSNELQQKVSESMAGTYLRFIPKNNFLLASTSGIEKSIENDYKKVRSVNVIKKFPDSLEVQIDERKGLLVWCKNSEECFLLDENGIAYSVADFNSPELTQNHLLQITDNSGANVALGDKVINQQYEKYLLAIGESLKSLGIETTGQYTTPSRMAEEIQAKTTQGFDLIFSTQFEIESAIKTLSIVLKKEIQASSLSNLAYIDLRSENKVFYKFNDGSLQQQTDATVATVDSKKVDDKKTSEKKK